MHIFSCICTALLSYQFLLVSVLAIQNMRICLEFLKIQSKLVGSNNFTLVLGYVCCATNRKVAGSIPAGVSGFFVDINSFRSHYDPGVDAASNRNENEEHFLGGKGGRCVRLTTLPPPCAVVTKSGNLNFLEPSGSVQACNGTALPFFLLGYVLIYLVSFLFTIYNLLIRFISVYMRIGWTVRGSNPGIGDVFQHPCRRALRSTHPTIQGVFPGGKAAGAWR